MSLKPAAHWTFSIEAGNKRFSRQGRGNGLSPGCVCVFWLSKRIELSYGVNVTTEDSYVY